MVRLFRVKVKDYFSDYSQIELRLIAEISGEENMIKAFKMAGYSRFYRCKIIPEFLWKVTKTNVHKQNREFWNYLRSKGAFTLAEQTGLSRTGSETTHRFLL